MAWLGRRSAGDKQRWKRDLQFTAGLYPLGMARHMLHVRGIDQFFAAADAGTLPAFCIVDPSFDELLGGEPPGHQRARVSPRR